MSAWLASRKVDGRFKLRENILVKSSPGRAMRDLVADSTIQVPGAFNALVGLLVAQSDYDAVYLSGAALSAGTLGMPDVGLFTLSELVTQTTYLTRSVDIPVIVDADTGFGEVINVQRTVQELEAAGAAAIQLEDQRLPKRCGHSSGKILVEPTEMCAKLRAAADARTDSTLVIVARTDTRGSLRWMMRSIGQKLIWTPAPIGFFPRHFGGARNSNALPRRGESSAGC
jgi:2-methylisocitrate lyase-like PEP mutase family enzyme